MHEETTMYGMTIQMMHRINHITMYGMTHRINHITIQVQRIQRKSYNHAGYQQLSPHTAYDTP